MIYFRRTTITFLFFIFLFTQCKQGESTDKNAPNILLIMTDDQAYGDLTLTGNTFVETPVIDKLAETGIFADHFYVSPVCAPTRASLLTGRYHQRTGVSGVTRGREDMRLNEETLANILKENGYNTAAFGKWHNGAHYPYHPLGRGFDEFVGFTSGHWSNYFNTTIEKNGKPYNTSGYLPDVLTNEAIDFIKRSSIQDEPFFCYLPFQTPHTPLHVPDKYFDKYKAKGLDDFNACIYGMCENIDDNIGRLLQQLDELKIRDNTIIIYLSDNGPLNFRYNQNLKGKKGSVDEGGERVPFIINWSKNKNARIINQALAHIDILPTILDLAEIKHKYANPIDGTSFAPLLKGSDQFPERNIYSEWSGKKRVLSNNFLLVDEELFNIEKDPTQTKNIRQAYSSKYDSLLSDYENWYTDVTQNGFETKPIPVGYNNYPTTTLPAHEANLYPPFEFRKDRRHTGIAYHSLYGWAHDWIDFWTNTNAYAQWEIDVLNNGIYDVVLKYALAPSNIGAIIEISTNNEKITATIEQAFEHTQFINHDRVAREQEAPETNWASITIGKLNLAKGKNTITVKSLKIPGEKSIELKELLLSQK